jgi:hypothetical protein
MVRIALVVAALLACAAVVRAQAGCAAAIAEFRAVVESDAKTGNLNKSVANRLLPELDRIAATCRAGKDADALRALAGLMHRYGYH